jgi:multidrug resistance efflux pump
MLMGKVAEWREVVQQQRMAVSLQKIAEGKAEAGPPSIASELERLKKLLDEGAITKDEYEAAKKRLLGT